MEKQIPVCSESDDIIIGSNGLRKRILHKGISWQTPIPGDEVQVHYSLRLEGGHYFDSSREKGETFSFRLGQCEVIKGWDEGIATMRKGERAVFTIPPELGYGEIGCPPTIPPNSTLIFDVELILWYPIRDISDSGDGGIVKKIITEGQGWATPKLPDEVLVKYVATYENGELVSKSDEGGLEFSLTFGHLCPAMTKAIMTMRKGERAELFVNFSYGLMECGNGTSTTDYGDIRSCSNLLIHLELVSWTTVIDVIGDGKILKKITRKGEAFDRPNQGSLAKVAYVGRFIDGTVFERQGSDEDPFEYVCAEEQINEGLDKAVMTMRKEEEAVVKIRSDNDSMIYEIKLIDFIKEKPFWKMDGQERLMACQAKKNEGNMLFSNGKFQLASNKYDKALQYIEYNHGLNDDEKLAAKSLKITCYLNNAATNLKLEKYKEASALCTKVLELNQFNVKALFRRSQAYISTWDLEKAEEDINRALAIQPNNKDVKIKAEELKRKRREYYEHEAKIFSTMISRIF